MENCIEVYSGSRNYEHVFYVFHFKRRSQPMKVIIHDLGDAVTYTPKKTSEDSVVLYANNQYASCQGCFKCWLKNAGFCIMKDSLLGLERKSQEKRRCLSFLLEVIPAVSSGRPKESGAPQQSAGFSASSGTVSRHGCGVPFRASLCRWPSIPCGGIPQPGGKLL